MAKMTYEAKITIELDINKYLLDGETLDEFIKHYGLTESVLADDLADYIKEEAKYYPNVEYDNPSIRVGTIKLDIENGETAL